MYNINLIYTQNLYESVVYFLQKKINRTFDNYIKYVKLHNYTLMSYAFKKLFLNYISKFCNILYFLNSYLT